MQIRDATADDADFLGDMLVEAVNWTGEQRVTRDDIEREPQLEHYIGDWPRADDFGVVAVDDDGTRTGAA